MKKQKGLMEQPCSECGGIIEKRLISQGFEREGVKIKLSGIKAWVCKGLWGDILSTRGG